MGGGNTLGGGGVPRVGTPNPAWKVGTPPTTNGVQSENITSRRTTYAGGKNLNIVKDIFIERKTEQLCC